MENGENEENGDGSKEFDIRSVGYETAWNAQLR